MSFNSRLAKAVSQGAKTAYQAPLAAFSGSQIALNTLVAGTTVSSAGLVIPLSNPTYQIEWESLSALVETNLATASITVASRWQYSPDGTNWLNIYQVQPFSAAQQTNAMLVAPAGAGLTQYFHAFNGFNPAAQAVRLAVTTGGATGGASDNVNVSYWFTKRWQGG